MKAQQTTAGPQEHDRTTGSGGTGTGTGTAGETGQLNRRTAKTHRQGATDTAREKGKIDGNPTMKQ